MINVELDGLSFGLKNNVNKVISFPVNIYLFKVTIETLKQWVKHVES